MTWGLDRSDAPHEVDYGFVPPTSHRIRVAVPAAPQDYYILLLPNATMLALSGMIEPLRVANQGAGVALYRWFTVSADGAPVRCSNGISLQPDLALADLPRSAQVMVCSGVRVQDSIDAPVVSWLRRHVQHGGGVGSLCAGVFALARAGVLRGRAFTLHWENRTAFCETFPDLQPTPHRYVMDQGLLSCGGGYAATDMMLEIIERSHGRELAVYVADMCMHARAEAPDAPQRTTAAAAYGNRSRALTTTIDFMAANLDSDLRPAAMARRVGISTRHLERLFRRHTGRSPLQMLVEMRLSRAYALLAQTDLPVGDIALAAGFSSTQTFSRRFRDRFGVLPRDYRRSWVATCPASRSPDLSAGRAGHDTAL